ncbi:MAG: 50S ribosomal protein L23 [Acidobacteria bacterium]|nr:50S ribosomal protein L23 [Acidobacteriota bacterium]
MSLRSHSLLRPVITEKSTLLKEKEGVLCFEVSRRATKIDIRRAVEEQYKVKVATVRTVRVPGKVARVGRFEGRKSDRRKAYVRLVPGQKSVEYYTGV